jgi:hypothetical protein
MGRAWGFVSFKNEQLAFKSTMPISLLLSARVPVSGSMTKVIGAKYKDVLN